MYFSRIKCTYLIFDRQKFNCIDFYNTNFKDHNQMLHYRCSTCTSMNYTIWSSATCIKTKYSYTAFVPVSLSVSSSTFCWSIWISVNPFEPVFCQSIVRGCWVVPQSSKESYSQSSSYNINRGIVLTKCFKINLV